MNGCQEIIKIKELSNHLFNCDFRKCKTCETIRETDKIHDCLENIKIKNIELKENNEYLKENNEYLKNNISKNFEEKDKEISKYLKEKDKEISDLKTENMRVINENKSLNNENKTLNNEIRKLNEKIEKVFLEKAINFKEDKFKNLNDFCGEEETEDFFDCYEYLETKEMNEKSNQLLIEEKTKLSKNQKKKKGLREKIFRIEHDKLEMEEQISVSY